MRQLFIILFLVITACLRAQEGINLEVSVLTAAPGPVIYELEGHAGIRIVITDSIKGRTWDEVYDWGNFDFNAPNFVYRFTSGQTDYSIGCHPTQFFVMRYAGQGRRVTEHHLSLTPEEKMRLYAHVYDNMLPENQVYRYNYVKDNCSTHIVTVIEQALGSQVTLAPSGLPATTFREAMRHYHTNYPWYQFGIDLALGAPLDETVTDRAMMFSPEALDRMILGAVRSDGTPLVDSSRDLFRPYESSAIDGPTPFYLTPMAVALVILLITIALTIRDFRRKSLSKWWDVLLFGVFGVLGLILTFLIFISVHEATSPNWLYLWVNPFCLIVPIAIWVKKAKKLLFCYQIVNFVLLLALCVIFLTGVQVANAAFYPLIAADAMRSLLYIYLYKCQHSKRPA